MAEAIPPKLGQFISQNVESVAQLEALLLLKREAGRALPVSEVAKVLYLAPAVCSEQLSGLVTRGILASESAASGELAYRYRPRDAETDALLGELETLYQQRRVAVVTYIYSKPVNKVQTFADAFRLRKEE